MWRTVVGSSATVQTHYVFDEAGHLLAEHDGATGAVLREYVWLDDTPVAMIDSTGASPATYYIHTGQIEEPLVMTDAGQAKVWDAYVEPFGSATVFGTPSAGLDLRLPGQFTEAETGGLNQNWNRSYDTSLGRYIQSDPLGIDAGQNVYGYVDGDPLSSIDPGGLQARLLLNLPPITSPSGNSGSNSTTVQQEAAWIDSVVFQTRFDAKVRVQMRAERLAYHKICDEPPPPGLCARDLALWKLNKARQCKKARQDFSNKWFDGQMDAGHQQQIDQLQSIIDKIIVALTN